MKLKIAVLYDGGGLARLGLEQAGHECLGVELDPVKHEMSKYVGSGNTMLADVLELDDSFYHQFDAVWSSPPCQSYSDQKTNDTIKEYGNPECLPHSIDLVDRYPHLKAVWIENVVSDYFKPHAQHYNAAQFLLNPVQRRKRLIAGKYERPFVHRAYVHSYKEFWGVCPPACLASEIGHGGLKSTYEGERRKFSRWFLKYHNRKPTVQDMADAQGFTIPSWWFDNFTTKQISTVLGNGVPVYMAKAFGEAYSKNKVAWQTDFFDLVH